MENPLEAAFSAVKRLRPRRPLGDEVYETLKKAIIKGDLAPGQRLIEKQLAEKLGASRTPIRQAFHMLEGEDLVEKTRRGGFQVKALSLADAADILDLRCVLEAFAARKAAEQASDRDLERLAQRNETYGRAVSKEAAQAMVALNTEFHDALYALSGNRRLEKSIHDLRDHFYRYRRTLLNVPNLARTSYEDHKEMIEAMKSGDGKRTEELVRDHILKGKTALMQAFEKALHPSKKV